MQVRYFFILLAFVFLSCNPFAPGLDEGLGSLETSISDQKTIDGVFQNFKYAYTRKDTTVYGRLIDGNFTFLYRDYDRGVDVSWGRDEEMISAYNLFRIIQRLDLLWNDIKDSTSQDSYATNAFINRSFNLTVTFSSNDIVYIDGVLSLQLIRKSVSDPWIIVRWKDEAY